MLLIFGCAASYVPPEDYVLIPPEEASICLFPEWSVPGDALLLRQTVFLEAAGHNQVLQGLVLLDPDRSRLQIVGMTELGMKLFDLTVCREKHKQNYMSPTLQNQQKALARQIAHSARILFLSGYPSDSPDVYHGPGSILMVSSDRGRKMVHMCSAEDNILKKSFSPDQKKLRLEYFDFCEIGGHFLPKRTVYQDMKAGYSLVIVLHEASIP